jgi:hypothetical protein
MRPQRKGLARFIAHQPVVRAEKVVAEVAAMLAVLSDKKAGYAVQLQVNETPFQDTPLLCLSFHV